MLLPPFLQILMTAMVGLTGLVAVLGVGAPGLLSKRPASLGTIRSHFVYLATLSLLGLGVLWSGALPRLGQTVLGGWLIAIFLGGLLVLPRRWQPIRLGVRHVVSAFIFGLCCWAGASEAWDAIRISHPKLPVLPQTPWVVVPLAIFIALWLLHRVAEVRAEMHARLARQ